MHRSIVPLVAILLLALGALGVSTASARTFRRTCRDGVPRLRKGIACDADGQSNDVCLFSWRLGLDGFSPRKHVFVPSGQKQVMELGAGSRLVLRCLRHHAVVLKTPIPPPGA